MTRSSLETSFKEAIAIPFFLLLLASSSLVLAQGPPYGAPDSSFAPAVEQPGPLFSPGELANLVAPIALYPDPLLSQVLVVSTYPQELVEAQQWLQQNGNLEGEQLMYAAQQENWDPSVQALVAFPDVMALLNRNIEWTTDLGRAFLAQPTDMMNAIQNLRAQARANGQLADTPELPIQTEFQNGEGAIEIQPADPRMMVVPAYDPYAVWGPPAAGSYPALPYQGSRFGSFAESAINLASMFAGFPGLLGANGWGWALSWLAHTLFVNNSFLSNFGFRNDGGGYGGPAVWVHQGARGSGLYAMNGGGWRPFGRGAPRFSGVSGAAFGPQRSAGGGNFQGRYWAVNSGNWRSFRSDTRPPVYQGAGRFAQPAWAGNRDFRASNRFAANSYRAGSGYRAPSTDWRSRSSGYGGFSRSYGDRTRASSRAFGPSRESWGRPSRSQQPRVASGGGFWSRHASAPRRSSKPPRFPKPQRFAKAPHFSAPHFKSHGSGHFSRGHSGGKSRH